MLRASYKPSLTDVIECFYLNQFVTVNQYVAFKYLLWSLMDETFSIVRIKRGYQVHICLISP